MRLLVTDPSTKLDATIIDFLESNALHYAAKSNSVEILKLILNHTISDPSAIDGLKHPALYSAVSNNSLEMVRALVQYSSINYSCQYGEEEQNLLHKAVIKNYQ